MKRKSFWYKKRSDYNIKPFRDWHKAVLKRDNYKCQMPNCLNKDKRRNQLQVHHIKMWSQYPELRYVISNGITLCIMCHKKIRGYEEYYEALFVSMINKHNTDLDIDVDIQMREELRRRREERDREG